MNASHEKCPIIQALLIEVRRASEGSEGSDFSIAAIGSDAFYGLWEDMEEKALNQYYSANISVLRGFYILELLATDVIPREIFSHGLTKASPARMPAPKNSIKERYPRTAEGVAAFCGDLCVTQKHFGANALTLLLKDAHLWNRGSNRHIASAQTEVMGLLSIALDAVDVFYEYLHTQRFYEIGRLGSYLWSALRYVQYTNLEIKAEIEALLSISEECALSPWQKKTFLG